MVSFKVTVFILFAACLHLKIIFKVWNGQSYQIFVEVSMQKPIYFFLVGLGVRGGRGGAPGRQAAGQGPH